MSVFWLEGLSFGVLVTDTSFIVPAEGKKKTKVWPSTELLKNCHLHAISRELLRVQLQNPVKILTIWDVLCFRASGDEQDFPHTSCSRLCFQDKRASRVLFLRAKSPCPSFLGHEEEMERAARQKLKERKARKGEDWVRKLPVGENGVWELPGEKQSVWTVGMKMGCEPLKKKKKENNA